PNNKEETSTIETTASLKRIKTTKSLLASASSKSDDENDEQDKLIEIDLMSIKKQLEIVSLIEI
ncbi:11464_t:CDS:2, partial [Racocetra fulgida]